MGALLCILYLMLGRSVAGADALPAGELESLHCDSEAREVNLIIDLTCR